MSDQDPFPLRCITVPPELTAVTGCNCGGLDVHRQDCTIFGIPRADAVAAIDAAHTREESFGAGLNARLEAAYMAAVKAAVSGQLPEA